MAWSFLTMPMGALKFQLIKRETVSKNNANLTQGNVLESTNSFLPVEDIKSSTGQWLAMTSSTENILSYIVNYAKYSWIRALHLCTSTFKISSLRLKTVEL